MLLRKSKPEITFVQPLDGECYFYTEIASSMDSKFDKDSKPDQRTQVYLDKDLALIGKLKLIFEREKMTWFEIKEEKSSFNNHRWYMLHYYPRRMLEAQRESTTKNNEKSKIKRDLETHESKTLKRIEEMFSYLLQKEQTISAEPS